MDEALRDKRREDAFHSPVGYPKHREPQRRENDLSCLVKIKKEKKRFLRETQ
jgi:hypothetical protein